MTLGEVKQRVIALFDETSGDYLNTDDLVGFINDARNYYLNLINKLEKEYFCETYSFTSVAGQEGYDLPSQFLSLLQLEKTENGVKSRLKPTSLIERLEHENDLEVATRYFIAGGQVRIIKVPDNNNIQFTMWYAAKLSPLVDDADETKLPFGWDEVLVLRALMKCLQKDRQSTIEIARNLEEVERGLIMSFRRQKDKRQIVEDEEEVN